jgi:hypothetical protein
VALLSRVLEDVADCSLGGSQAMKQALILVDVQESFRRRPYFRDEELPRCLRNVQSARLSRSSVDRDFATTA